MESCKLRLYEIAPNERERVIDIDTSFDADMPIIIGRNQDCDIQIGVIGRKVLIPHPSVNRQDEKIPISSLISRIQATIFRDDQGRLRIRSGNGKDAAFGLRDGSTDKVITRPWLLGPGAYIKLTPESAGYRCWLEWAADSCDADTPTLGFSQWQSENLQEEIDEQGKAIEALTTSLSQVKQESDAINKAQDLKIRSTEKKLARLKILGVVAIAGLLLTLGITSEQLQEIVQVVAVLSTAAGGGAILLQKEAA
ncbi:MAG: FHA domain-containing protein [Cyanobacteria bacterium J06649_12]